MSFGEALRQARVELGWTQPELARAMYEASEGRVDLTVPEISRYERGGVKSPRLDVIRAAAAATKRSGDFFTNTTQQEAGPQAEPFRHQPDASADERIPTGDADAAA